MTGKENQISLFEDDSSYEKLFNLKFTNYGLQYKPLINLYGERKAIKPFRRIKDGGLEHLLPLEDYDYVCCAISGGKDSIAVILYLLDLGIPKDKIILLHHIIDGKGDNPIIEMDWKCTMDYCQDFADVMGLKIRYSWREQGFAGELFRIGGSKPIYFEEIENKDVRISITKSWDRTLELNRLIEECKIKNDFEKKEEYETELKSLGYRMKFPAKSPSLSVRWCSSALKIEVCNRLLRYCSQLESNSKILFVDGIRREESAGRSRYNEMEVHSSTALSKGRLIHQWRPIIEWDERMVWEIMKRYNVKPHPCYYLGYSRCSCCACIFSMPCHYKGLQELVPDTFNRLVELEQELNFTIDNKKDILSYIDGAKSCVPVDVDKKYISYVRGERLPNGYTFTHNWTTPVGAYHGAEGGAC
jgi:hypothetical protein